MPPGIGYGKKTKMGKSMGMKPKLTQGQHQRTIAAAFETAKMKKRKK